MKDIFDKLGYDFHEFSTANCIEISTYYINNPDKTIRWIWNSGAKEPLFLKFYNTGSLKAELFSFAVQIIFLLKLQRLFFNKKNFYLKSRVTPQVKLQSDWALFTGTIGINNKAILYNEGHFYKIAMTDQAEKIIKNEFEMIGKLNPKKYSIPSVQKISNSILKLSDVSAFGKRETTISSAHIVALEEMGSINRTVISITDWTYFQDLKRQFYENEDQRIPTNLKRKIRWILESLPENEMIELGLSHGDFTPWNSLVNPKELAIYDWELASTNKPKAFDYFHFVIQNGILVKHNSWEKIEHQIFSNPMIDSYFKGLEAKKYLKYYLLINTLHHLQIYAQQENWHEQINWLLQTWSDAINEFVPEKNHRELVILDFFDALHEQDYATLKLPDEEPENLSQNSDIDLVLNEKLYQKTISFLKKHSKISKVIIRKKTFMSSVQILTKDARILSIDFIWKLKRKSLVILDAKKMIAKAETNEYGVKNADEKDTTKYLMFFYMLNNALIPKKYAKSKNKQLNLEDERKGLVKFLMKKPENKGLNRIINIVGYLKDTYMSLFNNRGFMITFSGVDGAGKTTVINTISEKIEKQLRKPVVVLRHRPSVLPILSVYTKGKEKAHEDVINSLPRKGTNRNFVSSMIRFMYYYTDYFFGQFIIYFKYILRGRIVIYDRYYFDFINDSKRSNIVLPKFITKIGYFFLLKPAYNFFLYAEPETILNRKAELSYYTVLKLTDDYRKLFHQLRKSSRNKVYKSIKNDDLETTINQLMNTMITKI